MGNNEFKLTKLALALGVTLSLSGCFSDNDDNTTVPKPPVPTQDVAVPPTAVETQAGAISVSLLDATGQPLADTVTATITFTSPEDGLLNVAGEALADADKSTTAGTFSFTVGSIPANGITYDYVVSADGYLNNSGSLTVTTAENVSAEEIRLTPRTLANSDIAIVAETKTLESLVPAGENTTVSYDPTTGLSISGDKTEIELPQSINKAGVAVGGTTVKIKNGTQFLTKDGTALTSAPQMTVAYFANEATRNDTETEADATENSSLDAFPGGLALSVANPDGTDSTVDGSFTSGGFVAIELVDDEGNKVSTFGPGNSITVAMQVDKNTSNPCPVSLPAGTTDVATYAEANGYSKGTCTLTTPTARKLAVGDIFPVWSYDEDAGKWSFESYGEVKDNGSADTFDVTVDVNHLSYWNLDYFNNNLCSSLQFDIVDSNDQPNAGRYTLLLETNGYRRNVGQLKANTGDYSQANIANPPAFPVNIKIRQNGKNVLDGLASNSDGTASKLSVNNLCDLNGETLKLTSTSPNKVSKSVTTQLVCSNTEDFDVNTAPVPTPTTSLLYSGNRVVNAYYGEGATFNVSLEEGASYTIRYYDYVNNAWLSQALAVNTTAVALNIPTVCEVVEQPITGGSGGSGGSGGN
ncbi:hypothetical protein IT970_03590 [Pseudoalteromonas sp. A41-2]|jgi:hypothetical protein|uniref:hypothetical protein n=1 Tax=unclassified Pseudoalteromonas TaxID=194690 RepID=UPI0015D556C7|nr:MULTISPECIES: hypothetical protein [unclassified Pseudoalteromonas]QLJ08941.1 hypothetical protein GZH31_03520 [Pseudoalteromonas sp. JSTW]QMW15173.1 hypothetical protein H3302_03415 [Pseudoalteromonas sp. MT33b]QPL43557.1 hypothetical protein IT970_03590 [Pseudoalteromonas sp. A41-2]|tara:strand:- start:88 stop:2004 length:1917 start_codon:yes stop_codon:yes gene_type:complete